jgi:galactose mutarotase-like enzyme
MVVRFCAFRDFLKERPSRSLEEAKAKLDAPDPYGNEAFKLGGAILLPYANRILGTLSADGKSIETDAAGQKISVPANWKGDNPGAQLHSTHGLILGTKFQDVAVHNGATSSTLSSVLHAKDFADIGPHRLM